MTHNDKDIIDEIVELSAKSDVETRDKLIKFLEIYKHQEEKYEKSLKKLDRCNGLVHKKDAENDKIIEQQSRQAAMGEMIDVVAHQWKQPLNSISMLVGMLKTDFKNGNVDAEYIDDLEQIVYMQITHMTTTLTEFRNFLRPNTKNEKFNLLSIINNVQVLMKDEILSQNIQLNVDVNDDIELDGQKNEFKHIFLNLINNSIDAFNENTISPRIINIKSYLKNGSIYITIEDNAGGISKKNINKIFQPNFTTKLEGKGTGIGLYITKQLVKKSHGTINVCNSGEGALFTIKLKK